MNNFLTLYITDKIITIAIQDKFTLMKCSLCIKFHKELGIFCFCESLFSWSRMFADSAVEMVTIQIFHNGSEAI